MNEYVWLNDNSQQFLDRDYLLPGQTVDERVTIICNTAEKILNKPGFAEKFKSYFKKGWYSFSTPVWTNFGTDRGLSSSCYGNSLEDNITSILSNQAEVGMMTKLGGGTSGYFGKIRPRGAPIKDNGESSGSVHFMQLFDNLINIISQGKCYIEGTEVLTNNGFKDFRNITQEDLVVQVNDDAVLSNTDKYELTIENFDGELICFESDKFLIKVTPNHRMVVLNEMGLNIILAKDLETTDKHNFIFIEEGVTKYLSGSQVKKYTEKYVGKVYCAVVPEGKLIVKYQGNAVLCGNTRRGNFAAYLPVDHKDIHEFLSIRSEGHPIQDLSFGVCVPNYWMEEMINGDAEKRKIWARILESRANTGYPYIFFPDNANENAPDVYKLLGLLITHTNLCCVTGDQRVVSDRGLLTVKELYEQGGPLKLFDGDKQVNASEMKLISKEEKVYNITLENGMSHKVTANHKVMTMSGMVRCDELTLRHKVKIQNRKSLFENAEINPINFKEEGNNLEFFDEIYAKEAQIIFANLGISTNRKKNILQKIETNSKFDSYCKVESIEYCGTEPVYCCEVYSDTHAWICNGIVTHNSEIMLPDNEWESFVCTLSSMNVLYYDEWKDTDAVELMTYFLDSVMTEFIEKAKNIPFMEKAVRFVERHRAMGIGQLGWHSYLQSKMIPFESMKAKLLNIEISKNIKEKSYAASAKLAQEYGEPELLKGFGRRNSVTCAVAPTKSSAFILGQVSEGIEPHKTNFYIKDLQKGKFTIKNTYLEKLLESKNKNTDEVWTDILQHGGSVQHLDFLDENEKNVFKTFAEISPREIIIQAAQRQKYIDQGQSLNLMIHPSIPIKDVNALLIEGWRLGVKSYYYQLSVNAAQQFSRSILSCSSCES